MYEDDNSSNLKLIDINGFEGCFDFNNRKKIAIYSLGSVLIYWDLEKDEKNFINFHQSTIAKIKISSSGNFFISIDKNKFPCCVLWEIPSFNIIYKENLTINFRSNIDEFPEETKFLREKFQTKNNFFNVAENIKSKNSNKLNDIFLEFFQSNFFYILINVNSDQYSNKGKSIYKNKNKEGANSSNNFKQIFYLFEIGNEVKLKFFKIIDEENECYGIKSYTNGRVITIENKLIKFWKVDTLRNTIKLKTKIHLKNYIRKDQLDICEYLKMILVMNDDRSCIILDETGLFLLSINSDFGVMFENKQKEQIYSISDKDKYKPSTEYFDNLKVIDETLYISTNLGNILIYDLNGFKYIGKIQYNFENKKKFLLNKSNKNYNKGTFSINNNMDNNNKYNFNFEDNQNLNNDSAAEGNFQIKNFFIDEISDLIIIKYTDNSIYISSILKNLKEQKYNMKNKYGRKSKNFLDNKNINNFNTTENNYNLEANFPNKSIMNNFFAFSHFKKITDICWLQNNYKSFITSSKDQSLMIWKFRGNKWINNYFDLLKIFNSNLNNFYSRKNYEDFENNENHKIQENKKSINNLIKPVNYYITVITCHPKNLDIILAGDNKGNIYQFDSELINAPKKFVVGNFGISHLKFSSSGEYLSVGFKVGNVVLLDFNNLCKFCFLVEDLHNDDFYISERERKREILSFGVIMSSSNLEFFGNKNISAVSKISETANNSIKILSMSSYKSLRMQMIKKSVINYNSNFSNFSSEKFEQGKSRLGGSSQNYFSTLIKNYEYNFNIKNIEMHNSEQYVIILFDNNSVIINRLEPNYISGIISLNNSFLEFYDFKLDPSGLYIAILSDAFANQDIIDNYFDENINPNINSMRSSNNNNNKFEEGFNSNSNSNRNNNFIISNGKFNTETTKNPYKDNYFNLPLTEVNFIKESVRKKSSIILYEIGTGNFVSILKNLFLISNFKFSNDGRFLCVATESGCVTLWNTSGEVRENIFSVIEECKINNRFWDNIRIDFLQDENNTKKFQKNLEKDEKNEKIEELKLRKKSDFYQEENNNSNNFRNNVNNVNNMNRTNRSSSKGNNNNANNNTIKQSIKKSNEKNSSSRSQLNKARISNSSAKKDTSYKSIYLNYENSLNKNTSNDDYSSYYNNNNGMSSPSEKNWNKLYNSGSNISGRNIENNNNNSNNMIYSSSNLYKKKEGNRRSFSNEKNNNNRNNNNNNNYKKSNDYYNPDYLIQNDINNNEFSQCVFPEPDDIDNLEDNKEEENMVNYNNNNYLMNKKQENHQIDSNDNSRNKLSMRQNTSDQIDFVDNKIEKFEKLIGENQNISGKYSSNYNTPKGFSQQTGYISGDSIENN